MPSSPISSLSPGYLAAKQQYGAAAGKYLGSNDGNSVVDWKRVDTIKKSGAGSVPVSAAGRGEDVHVHEDGAAHGLEP